MEKDVELADEEIDETQSDLDELEDEYDSIEDEYSGTFLMEIDLFWIILCRSLLTNHALFRYSG